jgi:hypothetical protein
MAEVIELDKDKDTESVEEDAVVVTILDSRAFGR